MSDCHRATAITSAGYNAAFASIERELALLECCTDVPCVDRLINILQQCKRRQKGNHVRCVIDYIHKKALDSHPRIGNFLVPALVDCGDISTAHQAFNRLSYRSLHAWNSLILGYVDHLDFEPAFKLYQQMIADSLSPSTYTYVALLKACTRLKDLGTGLKLRAEIAERGWDKDLYVSNALINMFGKCGALTEAQEVFDRLSSPDVVSWSSMITIYAENLQFKEAMKCFEQMQQVGMLPNIVTFLVILGACRCTEAEETGRGIHTSICKMGLGWDPYVGNTLVDMYSKCGSLAEAQAVFDQLPSQDAVSWNALITGYVAQGLGEDALTLFGNLQLQGFSPGDVVLISSLKACGMIGTLEQGKSILAEIVRQGLENDQIIGNVVVYMFCRCGDVEGGRCVFDKLNVRDAVSWSSLIVGYAAQGSAHEALKCYEEMCAEGVPPDDVILACSLKACCSTGAADKGWKIHSEIMKHGWNEDPFVGNALVDMYSKCGSVLDAQDVVDKLLVNDVTTWSALVKGYGLNQQGVMTLKTFEDMLRCNVKPDPTAFTCILGACTQTNLNSVGQDYFNLMKEGQGSGIAKHHCACMVDLLARHGHLYEAYRFINTMQYFPSKEMWKTLLGACKVHGEVEVGLSCFDQLMAIDSSDATALVLMTEVLKGVSRLSDAFNLERLRRETGRTKKPGSILIELNGDMHEFLVGDSQGMDSNIVGGLGLRMKHQGYVPGAYG